MIDYRRQRAARRAIVTSTVAAAVTALGLVGPAVAAQRTGAAVDLHAGQTGSLASVPWRSVGPAWDLAVYSASSGGEGVPVKAGPVTLYLVNPQGGRYSLYTWSAHSARASWQLRAWSGDGQRALFITGGFGVREQVHQLALRTGKVTSFTLPSNVDVLGYTRPDGLNVLAEQGNENSLHSKVWLERFNLNGLPQKKLAAVEDLGLVAYQPAGAELAAGQLNGLELIRNSGGVIRKLPVPGVKDGCQAVRWWSASTVLASCSGTSMDPASRMWLVPASGAKPTPLTPARRNGSRDLGDFNAWQLSSGLYLDALGPCGVVQIGKQPAHGPVKIIKVPGSASSLIITATSSRLLVQRSGGCSAGSSLIWLNPATGKYTVAVPAHGKQFGVVADEPWFVTGKF